MAKPNKIEENPTGNFDYSQYLPAELQGQAGQIRETGLLLPQYIPELAFGNADVPPIVGYLDRLVQYKEIKRGSNEVFVPLMVQVQLTKAAKVWVKQGPDDYKMVDGVEGDMIHFPVSANLLWNQDFVRAVTDTKRATFAILRAAGKVKVPNQTSPMWKIDCMMVGKPAASIVRTNALAFPLDVIIDKGVNGRPIARLSDGQIADYHTGELLEGQESKQLPQNSAPAQA